MLSMELVDPGDSLSMLQSPLEKEASQKEFPDRWQRRRGMLLQLDDSDIRPLAVETAVGSMLVEVFVWCWILDFVIFLFGLFS
jgi:hypothetical protein